MTDHVGIGPGDPTGKKCLYCGVAIVRRNSHGPIPKYCSDECRSSYGDLREAQRAAERRQDMTCEYCGRAIPDRGRFVRYCNRDCSKAKHYQDNMQDPEFRRRRVLAVQKWRERQRERT